MNQKPRKTYSPIERHFLNHILNESNATTNGNIINLKKSDKKKLQKYTYLYNKGFPIDYITGKITIQGLVFFINKNVLIPRPETEELIEIIKNNITDGGLLVDVGTGSGLIGITLSDTFKKIALTDISQKALYIAKKNIRINKKIGISTFKANLLQNFRLKNMIAKSYNWVLVANLPYVPESEIKNAKENNISHEPFIALYSGKDGLDCFRELVKQLAEIKNKPARCFFELDPRNINLAKKITEKLGYRSEIIADQNGFDRFLITI